MSRWITSAMIASGFAVAVYAQDTTTTKTKTEVKGRQEQTVSYTGCVQTGTEAKSYVLDKVVPVGRSSSTEVGTSGTITKTDTTTYMLVPGERVEIQSHVGHKVEVTGMMIPAGKTRSETKIENEHGPDTTIKQKSEHNMPEFRVISIKELSESC